MLAQGFLSIGLALEEDEMVEDVPKDERASGKRSKKQIEKARQKAIIENVRRSKLPEGTVEPKKMRKSGVKVRLWPVREL